MLRMWNWAPDSGANSGGSGAGNNQGGQGGNAGGNGSAGSGDAGQGQGLTFDSWITEQPDDIKSLLEEHTKGLKSALASEKDARKNFEKQIKDLAGKAEKGSEFERQLAEIAKANERAQSQADFYEQAHAAGVSNLKLAFIVAEQDQLMDGRGRVNFEEMRKRYPELFGGERRQAASGNAGAGTGGSGNGAGQPGQRMNDFIRTAAGRK